MNTRFTPLSALLPDLSLFSRRNNNKRGIGVAATASGYRAACVHYMGRVTSFGQGVRQICAKPSSRNAFSQPDRSGKVRQKPSAISVSLPATSASRYLAS